MLIVCLLSRSHVGDSSAHECGVCWRKVREDDFEPFLGYIIVQAEALYAD